MRRNGLDLKYESRQLKEREDIDGEAARRCTRSTAQAAYVGRERLREGTKQDVNQ